MDSPDSSELVFSDALLVLDRIIVQASALSPGNSKVSQSGSSSGGSSASESSAAGAASEGDSKQDGTPFETLYEDLHSLSLLDPDVVLSTPCHRVRMGNLITEIHASYSKLFDFSSMLSSGLVSESKNQRIMALLLEVVRDRSEWASEMFLASVYGTIRVLSRSRVGVSPTLETAAFLSSIKSRALMTDEMMDARTSAEICSHKRILKEAMACLVNAMVISRVPVSRECEKLKLYRPLIKILQKLEGATEAGAEVQFYTLHLLFYLSVERNMSKVMYEDLEFFRKLFDIFMCRTERWMKRESWDRSIPSVDMNCKIIREVCRVLFNFTVVEQHIVKFKLDKFDDTYTRSVVKRVCQVLSLPLDYEPSLKDICEETNRVIANGGVDQKERALERMKQGSSSSDDSKSAECTSSSKMKKKGKRKQSDELDEERMAGKDILGALVFNDIMDAGLDELLDVTPGLLSVKMGLIEVCIYDGDILAMNLPLESWQPLSQMLHFKLMICSREERNYDKLKTVCPTLMFFKLLVSYNSKIRGQIKKYIFGEDAEIPEPDSDEESEEEDPDDPAPVVAKYDLGDKDALTLRNSFLKHLTSVEYSTKRLVGEFLFALMDENTSEMLRLCGLGAGIGILVDKGLPGFAGIGSKPTSREDIQRITETARKKKELAELKKGPKFTTTRKIPKKK